MAEVDYRDQLEDVVNAVEDLEWIFAGQDGVGRIIIDAEIRVFADGLDEVAEDVHRLCELGEFPEPILVVVL